MLPHSTLQSSHVQGDHPHPETGQYRSPDAKLDFVARRRGPWTAVRWIPPGPVRAVSEIFPCKGIHAAGNHNVRILCNVFVFGEQPICGDDARLELERRWRSRWRAWRRSSGRTRWRTGGGRLGGNTGDETEVETTVETTVAIEVEAAKECGGGGYCAQVGECLCSYSPRGDLSWVIAFRPNDIAVTASTN